MSLYVTIKANDDILCEVTITNRGRHGDHLETGSEWRRYAWQATGKAVNVRGAIAHRRQDGMPALVERVMRELDPHWPIPID